MLKLPLNRNHSSILLIVFCILYSIAIFTFFSFYIIAVLTVSLPYTTKLVEFYVIDMYSVLCGDTFGLFQFTEYVIITFSVCFAVLYVPRLKGRACRCGQLWAKCDLKHLCGCVICF